MEAKTIALNTLENAIKYRWNALPQQQRDGIKTYLVNLVIKISSDAKLLKDLRVFIGKANKVLVEVVKHEWPHRWPNFIKEIVNSSKTSQTLCANNMSILLLLRSGQYRNTAIPQYRNTAIPQYRNSQTPPLRHWLLTTFAVCIPCL